MDSLPGESQFTCQVVAIPYPGRGHINPMMNLCKLIVSRRPDILITFIVTEEWYGFIGSESRPQNIRFGKIPNIIPSEIGRGKDISGFVEAVLTKMESPIAQLLDHLEPPFPSVILYDTYLSWAVDLANRRNIPAASFWTQSATVFSIIHHFDVLLQKGHIPCKQSEELVNYIPGIPSIRVPDLPRVFLGGKDQQLFNRFKDAILMVSTRAQYLLFSSVHELESQVIDTLKTRLSIPIYSIGPAIPYFKITEHGSTYPDHKRSDYFAWLDAQPRDSVLYISQGSFLSSSSEELKEIVAGVHDSGVRFFMVAREDVSASQGGGSSDKGLIVPWCDQLKVLCHPSIGGFWSHCGWSSTKEGAYAGIPMLTFPIIWDQFTNSKQIVVDWKMGWRVKRDDQSSVTREEISSLLKRFMDLECDEGKEMRRRAEDVREICRRATAEGGSAQLAIEAFINNISK